MKQAAVRRRLRRARRCLRMLERVARRGRPARRRSLRGPGSRRAGPFERLGSSRLEAIDQAAHPHGEGGADLLSARRELLENASERLLGYPNDNGVFACARADAPFGRGVKRALADEGACADAPPGVRLPAVLDQYDGARMDEITGIGGFAGKEQSFAGPQAPFLT